MMMNRKMLIYVLIIFMLLTPIALTIANAADKPDVVTETEDAFYEACGEIEPFDDPSNQHSLASVREDLNSLVQFINELSAGTPTDTALDEISKKMVSSCLSAATLTTDDRKALSPDFKMMLHQYDELMTKVQEMEIPQTGSDE